MKQTPLSLDALLGGGLELLDRYAALLDEDQALRAKQYDAPLAPASKHDPLRRPRRNSCRDCTSPWCCNQRVTLHLAEALVLYRFAARHARQQLTLALDRTDLPDDNHDFFRRRVPCAFLVRGRCAVYAVRPHACRSHYMAGPPVQCRNQLAPSQTYEMNPDNGLLNELDAVAEELRWELGAEEEEPGEMSAMLRQVHALALGDPPAK